ncbi:late competence development ComFB family protein [Phormidium sp. FACHB-1136]|uniref:late competence development ComFB family protein n=1 Tax=Phormidium sp. FACHB-1136 TaxID=2692848 RepID=UPI001685921A|nr:late competence development ComFB family protein [Phormidium sp. FACHB-1136]MBD2424897.1 late competence development ComFB family protein [Phormidium sp. FACHB-1136]
MKIAQDSPRRAYINVMELLVAEEVEQQLKDLPPRVAKYLKVVEVETYALNRLPALYASSEKGWRHQYEKAKRELRNQIKSAVRQAIAAVQVDPIRSSEPLQLGQEDETSGVLDSLRDILSQPDLGWDGVVSRLREVMGTNRSGGAPQPSASSLDSSHRTRYRPISSGNYAGPSSAPGFTATAPTAPVNNTDVHGQHWRPGTYGSSISWQRRHSQESAQKQGQSDAKNGGLDFDWNDSRYSQ